MNNIRAIRTEEDYEAALARIEEIFDAEESTSVFQPRRFFRTGRVESS